MFSRRFMKLMWGAAICSILLFGGLGVSVSLAYNNRYEADMRVFNGIAGLDEVEIWIGDVNAGSVAYGDVTGIILVTLGDVQVRAIDVGGANTTLFERVVTVRTGQHFNTALLGFPDDIRLRADAIPCDNVEFGFARIIFTNAIAGAESVATSWTAESETVTSRQAFGESRLADAYAARFILKLPEFDFVQTLNLSAGTSYLVYYTGAADGSVPISVTVVPGVTVLDAPSGHLRFVNAIDTQPAVDFYLNDTLIGVGVPASSALPYMGVAPGGYVLDVFAAEADPSTSEPLLSSSIEVVQDESLVVVAQDTSDPELLTFTDNRTTTGPALSGLSLFNATGVPVGLSLDDKPLFSAVEPGAVSMRFEMVAGQYTLAVNADDGGTLHTLENFAVSPATAANLRVLIVTETALIPLSGRSVVLTD